MICIFVYILGRCKCLRGSSRCCVAFKDGSSKVPDFIQITTQPDQITTQLYHTATQLGQISWITLHSWIKPLHS